MMGELSKYAEACPWSNLFHASFNSSNPLYLFPNIHTLLFREISWLKDFHSGAPLSPILFLMLAVTAG